MGPVGSTKRRVVDVGNGSKWKTRLMTDYTVSLPQAKSSNNATSPETHRLCYLHILHCLLYPHSRGGGAQRATGYHLQVLE
ncbi:hypothetical protein P691DRAFT_813572 [Macrolepiota fuliginosa MF-IS2]|uniref:Uncharacterized protein n=1 Tax=Macrolepiota fuliginosa MF-IS2 TaxID=1400762 RepID=A0A9P5X051_9AGAR|nr:hypothetical protein P691DRAFT_813572 [Macrolepiota fuliginosa MF-IS2]